MPHTWGDLSDETRALFEDKLAGLYHYPNDEAAYNYLAPDKQEALSLLSGRLASLGLWQHVRRIVNVYGQGGVGMYFSADSDFEAILRGRKDITNRFARHRDNNGGFFEKRRRRAALHFLFIDPPSGEREWHVHLDFYGPMGSVLSTTQHLIYERFGKFRPDYRMMKALIAGESQNPDLSG